MVVASPLASGATFGSGAGGLGRRAALGLLNLVVISDATFTLQSTYDGACLSFSSGSAVTLTVPSGLGAGFSCAVIQSGAGTVTPTASGATINNRQSHTGSAGQYAVISLIATAADVFVMAGDTA